MTPAKGNLHAAELSDALLIERAGAGDDRALGQLYQRHARYVARVAWRLGAGNDVDDVVQETFLAAIENLSSLRDAQAVRPWLARIAARKVLRRVDSRGRFRNFLASLLTTAAPRSEPHVAQAISSLGRALGELPSELRVPWVLYRVEAQTLADVASATEVSLATVKRRIAEADHRLGDWKGVTRGE